MTDIRKQVVRPDADGQQAVREIVHAHLLAVTETGAEAIGATGASFVLIAMGVWMGELAELDGRAAARYLRALADIADPKTNDAQKRRAEEQRAKAVRALYAAVDLDMAASKGTA